MTMNLRKRSQTSMPNLEEEEVKRHRNNNDMVKIPDKDEQNSQVEEKINSEDDDDDDDDYEEEAEEDEEDDDEDDEEDEDEDIMTVVMDKELEKLKNTEPAIYSSLLQVKDEIARTEPDVKKMLLTPLRLEDKAKICQLYEIYKNLEPNTEEWLNIRNKYNFMLKEYKSSYEESKKYTTEDISRMKEEEEKHVGFDSQLTLKYKILNLETSKKNKEYIYRRYEYFVSLNNMEDEYTKLKHWLTRATDFPHDKKKEIIINDITEFIKNAKLHLDKELYGMSKVKEQILLFLSAKLLNPNMIHSNLALVGSPGIGKTKIARLIADILGGGFAQISFGGVDRADFLKGHEYTYIGAQPGEVVKCVKKIGYKNGVILFDEIERGSENQDIRSALLHMIDTSQNYDYHDNFLGSEISIDLSNIWFIGSMNSKPKDEAFADRWWFIDVEGYSHNDKIQIIQKYLLPRELKNCDMLDKSINFDNEETISYLIRKICKPDDRGVRTLEKFIKDIVNKVNFLVKHQDSQGKMPFQMSFEIEYKITFPVVLNIKLLDKLIETKDIKDMINTMYI